LTALGTQFVPDAAGGLTVHPGLGPAVKGEIGIDAGLAGTVMRFVPPLVALTSATVRFTGDPAAAARPMAGLLDALGRLGVAVAHPTTKPTPNPPGQANPARSGRPAGLAVPAGQGDTVDAAPAHSNTQPPSLPFSLTGTGGMAVGAVTVDASASSQFLSGLLLAAPRFTNGLAITLDPPVLPSRPHVDLTLEALSAFGATATQTGDCAWRVEPGGLEGRTLEIEPDLSNAAPFLAAALVAGGTVRVPHWPAATAQPGDRLRDYLAAMGATVTLSLDTPVHGDQAAPPGPAGAPPSCHRTHLEPPATPTSGGSGLNHTGVLAVTGRGPSAPIQGADLDLGPAGELTPTLAALAALAATPSRFRGIGHLRGHETNRLAALTETINALGGRATELEDGLAIEPAPLHGGVVDARGDHRLATFGAILGLRVPGVVVDGIGATAKTLPTFPSLWAELVHG
jgi:3-phosphoshikimate 1-carboxyvinyltransferase